MTYDITYAIAYDIVGQTYDVVCDSIRNLRYRRFYPLVDHRTLRYSIRLRRFRKTSHTIVEGYVGIIRLRRLLYDLVGNIGINIRLTPTLSVLTS